LLPRKSLFENISNFVKKMLARNHFLKIFQNLRKKFLAGKSTFLKIFQNFGKKFFGGKINFFLKIFSNLEKKISRQNIFPKF